MSERIVCDEDVKVAEAAILELGGFKKFLDKLKTPREQKDFRQHLRKYISIWLPDCPWEVTTTNRYTVITHEAAVVARRDIKKGETINYLCGTLVEMTAEEEQHLDLTRRDFSIVTSSRSKRTSLFLGPARFANHDCKANARLTTTGSWGMSVVAVRAIDEGEEITVTYGENYFGENNCECLCGSCEQTGIGGWTKSDTMLTIETSATPDEGQRSYSLRRSTKPRQNSYSPSTPDPETFVPMSRRCSGSGFGPPSGSLTPVGSSRRRSIKSSLSLVSSALARFSPDLDTEQAIEDDAIMTGASGDSIIEAPPLLIPSESILKENMAASVIKQEYPEGNVAPAFEAAQAKRVTKLGCDESLPAATLKARPLQTDMYHELDGCTDTAVSKPSRKRSGDHLDTHDIPIKRPRIDATESLESGPTPAHASERPDMIRQSSRKSTSPDSLFEKDQTTQVGSPISSQADGHMAVTPCFKLEEPQQVHTEKIISLKRSRDDDESDLSELDSDEEFNDEIMQIVRRRKRRKANTKKPPRPSLTTEPPGIPRVRYSGDYAMTVVLLAEPFACWTQCKTCKNVWVQANGYCIRRECPRCERHSKLYGYQWPKMHDPKTERVADHRTVHRFLSAAEQDELRSKMKFME